MIGTLHVTWGRMNATILSFLTTDGTVTATYPHPLTPEQYSRLYAIINQGHYTTEELRVALQDAAADWDVPLIVDVC